MSSRKGYDAQKPGTTLYWENMESEVSKFVKHCKFQRLKKKKYWKLLPKNVAIPWGTVYFDLVGPYTVISQGDHNRILIIMTFVDSGTVWFEIAELCEKTSERISQIFNGTWISCYPRLRKVIFDNGNEFKNDFFTLLKDFGIKPTPTTIKIIKAKVYWKEFIKFQVTCWEQWTYKNMNLMTWIHGVNYSI